MGQATVRWDAVPIETEFLEHCTAWAETLDGCKEVFEFGGIIRVNWKSVEVDANPSEDVFWHRARVIAMIGVG